MSLDVRVGAEEITERPEGRSEDEDDSFEKPLRETSEENLFCAYLEQGDRDAFTVLIGRIQYSMTSYLRKLLGNEADADDVWQNVCMRLSFRNAQFDRTRSFRSWLYAVVNNAARDSRRRQRKHTRISLDGENFSSDASHRGSSLLNLVEDHSPDVSESFERSEDILFLQERMARLPERERQAIHLIYTEGLKYTEAALMLGIPQGTVKSRVYAALEALHSDFTRRNRQSEHHPNGPLHVGQHARPSQITSTPASAPWHPGTANQFPLNVVPESRHRAG